MRVVKYQVILINSDYSCKILKTFTNRPNAVEFMGDYCNKNYIFDGYKRAELNSNELQITIFNLHRFFKKTLDAQLSVIQYYDDCECNDNVYKEI